jgi:hypothetical protein
LRDSGGRRFLDVFFEELLSVFVHLRGIRISSSETGASLAGDPRVALDRGEAYAK